MTEHVFLAVLRTWCLLLFSIFFVQCNTKTSILETQIPEGQFRGVWVTNVGSDAMKSKENIQKLVANCKKYKINHLFVVVWNKGLTQYPSSVLESYIGIKQEPLFAHFDPLQVIIEQAHKEGIKVHAWFEFGFSFAYNDPESIWIKKYPEWLGKDQDGKLLTKNSFMWWNALHPGPQKFLLELIEEVVTQYAVDGIQGDDRLPAMPSEGGYDTYTRARYKEQYYAAPPSNYKQKDWVSWRSQKLTEFAGSIYTQVKTLKPQIQVSWAPSIYPWSEQEYLQAWPDWIKAGYADFVVPQFYRYKLGDYTKIIDALEEHLSPKEREKIYAGVLTSLGGGYRVNDTLLINMIKYHRSKGISGEVFFYYETFNSSSKTGN